MNTPCETSDILVFSHHKWNMRDQRPQHLISRYAQIRRVFFIETPTIKQIKNSHLYSYLSQEGVTVISPILSSELSDDLRTIIMEKLLDQLIHKEEISDFTALYHTSEALNFTRNLSPSIILFDCFNLNCDDLDEELMSKAQLVFSRGEVQSKFKRSIWKNIFSYPCSVDFDHFSKGRKLLTEPADQKEIPYPRIGFYGDLKNINFKLLDKIAELRPEFQLVVLNECTGPKRENIHYLGLKDYSSLPSYFSGWDCAFLPYSIDVSSGLITSQQIPELLSSAIPVVSTSIYDSVHPYFDLGLVHIADHPEHFVQSIESAITDKAQGPEWLERVDHYLLSASWDTTFELMSSLEHRMKRMMQNIRQPAYEDSSLSAIGIV